MNPDLFNWILLTLDDLKWGRDPELPPGNVRFVAMTDGRVIGVNRYFLSDARDDFETLYIEPHAGPQVDDAGNWVGQWLVGDGCYQGDAGATNNILFWVEGGVIAGILDRSQESLDRTFDHMMGRLEAGDVSVIVSEAQRTLLDEDKERRQSLPRLGIPGELP